MTLSTLPPPPADQAQRLRELLAAVPHTAVRTTTPSVARAATIAVASGKGGVGKTQLVVNLGMALVEQGAKVCLLDGAIGLGHLDLVCGRHAYWNLGHVLSGSRTLEEVLTPLRPGLDLLAGLSELAKRPTDAAFARRALLSSLQELETRYDYLLLDTSAGLRGITRQLAESASSLILATTTESLSLADTYASLKHLSLESSPRLSLCTIHTAQGAADHAGVTRLTSTAQAFLNRPLATLPEIPFDSGAASAIRQRRPLWEANPSPDFVRAIRSLARALRGSLQGGKQLGSSYFTELFARIANSA